MALKIGDVVTITIGQPIPEGDPVDELIYTKDGYFPRSMLDYKSFAQDGVGITVKQDVLRPEKMALLLEKSGTFAHIEEYRLAGQDEIVKRSVFVHTHDSLEMFPQQGQIQG